tara:strand:+ start:3547 stop:3744 length:198 start_codon:yes stop_codon:yes gene_type:complete
MEEMNENNEEEVERDVEVMEFALDNEEIDELIESLKELKENKKHIMFDIDEDHCLMINYDEEEVD